MRKTYATSALSLILVYSVTTSSESPNYSLIGGDASFSLGEQSSSNYSVRAYVSPFNSSRSVESASMELREGYLGLLVEPMSMDVAIAPDDVNEDSTVKMDA